MFDETSAKQKDYHKRATPSELVAIAKRHRGELAKIAQDLEISQSVITEFGTGRNKSPRVEEALRARVKELLAKEKELANAR